MEYVKNDDPTNALASMFSDLTKHSETENHPAIQLGGMLMLGGKLSTTKQVSDFIQGFN